MTRALNVSDVARAWLRSVRLEEMLTHPLLFGLTTASPLQRAICRITDGKPLGDLARDPTVLEALGTLYSLEGRPDEVAIVAGIRTYKSGFAACAASQAALQCDAEGLRPGEMLRVPIVSTKLENAKAVYQHLAGAWSTSPLLKQFLVTNPANSSDRFTIRRPDGVLCEFLTVAGSRAGAALVSFWLAACIFDEYARMTGDPSEGVINWSEQRAAVLHRIRRRGFLLHISSPLAPFGPCYDHVAKYWGKPTKYLVVVRARADHMNPVVWTKEVVAEAAIKDPESYRTDILAEFASPETQFFHLDHVKLCLRASTADEPRIPGASYTATMDPATRGNGWTFGIFTRDGKTRRMVVAREWVGSRAVPLDPEVVLIEVQRLCAAYGITTVDSDQWAGDALATIARRLGLSLYCWTHTDKQRTERYLHVRTMLAKGEVSLPDVEALRTDLLRVRKRVTASGASVDLPETTDGRHCDWAPTIVAGLCRYVDDVSTYEPPAELLGQLDAQRIREAALREMRRGEDDDA